MLVLLMMPGLLTSSNGVLLFLWIMVTNLSTSKAVKFSVLVPNSVSALSGSSVILPCGLSPSYDAETFEFCWCKNDDYDNPVLLYENLKVQENAGDPQYRGRVYLIGELDKGNISLKLENLTLADNGEYMCNVEGPQWYDRANISLLVKALGTLPVLSFAEAGEWMNVTCASGGWSPKPSLTWRDRGGRELESGNDHYITAARAGGRAGAHVLPSCSCGLCCPPIPGDCPPPPAVTSALSAVFEVQFLPSRRLSRLSSGPRGRVQTLKGW
ncbi:butyrophilin subfamily 2 member A2-like [Colossoma macropomum]|uniref:butyrophilin subfamily 2 member A2-like n=1 Tax=Colossoma macropomum TaxID=42526 RepID=UPI001863BDED|nr:butyrophilin subfamily 2 member A2-like [Colossoma macropomum]